MLPEEMDMKVGIVILGFLILVCAGILSAGILSSGHAPENEPGNGTLIAPSTITPATIDVFQLEESLPRIRSATNACQQCTNITRALEP